MANMIFKNQPTVPSHAKGQEVGDHRARIVPLVKELLSNHEKFGNADVTVTFAEKGVSSLVSIIETPDEKLVLKIPLSTDPLEGEIEFLRAWEDAGVSVPRIFEAGRAGDYPYTLMSYVDAPTLMEAHSGYSDLVEKKSFIQMGKTLRAMHEPVAYGYGRVVGMKGRHADFSAWFKSEEVQHRISGVNENSLLGPEHGSLEAAFEVLTEFTTRNPNSSYCHYDFSPGNIFATQPITVFDPNPMFHHGYMDLGRSMVLAIAVGGIPEAADQLRQGYFQEDEKIDENALYSTILLNSYLKFHYWNKVKNVKKIKNIQKYLKSKQGLLL